MNTPVISKEYLELAFIDDDLGDMLRYAIRSEFKRGELRYFIKNRYVDHDEIIDIMKTIKGYIKDGATKGEIYEAIDTYVKSVEKSRAKIKDNKLEIEL